MILSLIVAADENNCIGGENKLLWKLPDDLLSNKLFLDKLEIGMEDIKNGRIITLEESNRKIDEWLKK